MSDTVAIDALPYYDRGYDEPGVREAAMQLVQEEMQRYRPTKDYLENLPSVGKSKLPSKSLQIQEQHSADDGSLKLNLDPDVFLSDLMKNEMTRIKDKKQMELLSTERYNLPAPTPGLRHDPEAWIQAGKIKLGQLLFVSSKIPGMNIIILLWF